MMKTLGQTTWEEIEIGEIFATNGCWDILCKTSEKTALLLASDDDYMEDEIGKVQKFEWLCEELHKLPKTVQSHWKTE